MQSSKFCPKCGKQNTIILSDNLGEPFTKKNKPSVPRGDALYAGINYDDAPPLLLSPGICDDCGEWFAIHGIGKKEDINTE